LRVEDEQVWGEFFVWVVRVWELESRYTGLSFSGGAANQENSGSKRGLVVSNSLSWGLESADLGIAIPNACGGGSCCFRSCCLPLLFLYGVWKSKGGAGAPTQAEVGRNKANLLFHKKLSHRYLMPKKRKNWCLNGLGWYRNAGTVAKGRL